MKYFCLLDVSILLICDCLVSVVLFDAFFSAFNFTPFTLLFLQNKRLGGFLTACSSIIDNGLFPTRLFKTRNGMKRATRRACACTCAITASHGWSDGARIHQVNIHPTCKSQLTGQSVSSSIS